MMNHKADASRYLALIVVLLSALCAAADEPLGTNDLPDTSTWRFSESVATILSSVMTTRNTDYDVVLSHQARSDWFRMDIQSAGVSVFTGQVSAITVFCIDERKLYYVDFRPPRKQLVAYDLDTRRSLWESALPDVAPLWNGFYRWRWNIRTAGRLIEVLGEETGGRYMAFFNKANGSPVGLKQFGRKDEPAQQSAAPLPRAPQAGHSDGAR